MEPVQDYPLFEVRVPGRDRLQGVTNFSIDSSFVVPTDGYNFTMAVDSHEDTRVEEVLSLILQPCELLMDGASQMLGWLEFPEMGDGSLTFSGRDYFCNLVEGHVDPAYTIPDQATLGQVLLELMGPIGIDTLVGDDDVPMRNIRTGKVIGSNNRPLDFKELKLKEINPKGGKGLWELIEDIATRHGCTVQPGPDRRTAVLCAPNYKQETSGKLYRYVKSGGNIISGTASRNFSTFPTCMLARGKGGGAAEARSALDKEYDIGGLAENFNAELARIIDERCVTTRQKLGTIGDPNKLYRFHVYEDTDAKTIEQLERSSRRRMSELLRPTLVFKCTVAGFHNPAGGVWAINTMLKVQDEKTGINEPMWVASRKFNFAPQTTEMELWRPATYQI